VSGPVLPRYCSKVVEKAFAAASRPNGSPMRPSAHLSFCAPSARFDAAVPESEDPWGPRTCMQMLLPCAACFAPPFHRCLRAADLVKGTRLHA
jgi:hypothetical protein